MKTPAFLLYASLFGLVANLFVGCASKSRPYEWTSTVVTEPDGTRTETRAVKRDSTIRASGYKLDLAGFGVEETWQEGTSEGPGDSSYKLNSEGAKATPESQALAAFQSGLGVAAQLYGLQPNEAGVGIPIELQDRIDKLEEGLTNLAEVAEAIRAERLVRTNTITGN